MRHVSLLLASFLAAGAARAQVYAVAPKDGAPVVTLFDRGGGGSIDVVPYPGASGGANVSFGDCAGDGEDDLLTGPGGRASNGPHVRAFRLDGSVIAKVSFYAYATLKYGVNVAGADLDDAAAQEDEIVTGAGPSPQFGPHVRGFKLTPTGMTALGKVNFFAYQGLTHGVRVGSGDFDADGHEDILATPAIVGGIRAFSFGSGTIQMLWGTAPGGLIVNSSPGDVDGDAFAEILAAPGPYPTAGSDVSGFDVGPGGFTPIPGLQGFATFPGSLYGADVSCGNLDGDAASEFLVTPGPDPAAGGQIKGFAYDGGSVTELFFDTLPIGPTYYGMNHAVSDEL